MRLRVVMTTGRTSPARVDDCCRGKGEEVGQILAEQLVLSTQEITQAFGVEETEVRPSEISGEINSTAEISQVSTIIQSNTKPPIKDTPKEHKPPNKGRTLEYTL